MGTARNEFLDRLTDDGRWKRSDVIRNYLSADLTLHELDAVLGPGPARISLEAMLRHRREGDAQLVGLRAGQHLVDRQHTVESAAEATGEEGAVIPSPPWTGVDHTVTKRRTIV